MEAAKQVGAQHEAAHAVGSVIEGRCVTMGCIYTGVVTDVIRTPGEYALRYRIACSNVARRNPIVFAIAQQGSAA